jgi:hypothetical protein
VDRSADDDVRLKSGAEGIVNYNLDVALRAAATGLYVFPADPATKRPLVRWAACSTNIEAGVRYYWDVHRSAAVGLDCGKSGLFVIDLDRGHADGVDGVSAFDKLLDDAGEDFPFDGPATKTPRGGFHIILRQPVGRAPLGNSNRNLPPGIDIRGAGGFVIAPGSIMATGEFYESEPSGPDLYDVYPAGIPVVPDWLVYGLEWREPVSLRYPPSPAVVGDAAERQRRMRRIMDLICGDLARMPPESGRNNALNVAACRIAGNSVWGSISESEAWAALHAACHWNGLLNEDGERACYATFLSGWRFGIAKPLSPPRERLLTAA